MAKPADAGQPADAGKSTDGGFALVDFRKRRDPLRLKYWKERVPAGNSYRVNALQNAKYQVSYEVQHQLRDLAQQHKELLKAKDDSGAYSELLKSLEAACVLGQSPFEADSGFRPIEEFTQVRCRWFIYRPVPASRGSTTAWIRLQIYCFMVWIVQVITPAAIFVDVLFCSHNILVYKENWKLLDFYELVSPGESVQPIMITFVGMALLSMFLMIMSGYASREFDNCWYGSRIPLEITWTVLGNFANAWNVLMLSAVVWFQFWNREQPFYIVVDAMGFIFLLTLDDLSAAVSSFLGTNEEDFEEDIINYAVCLTHLPIEVKDLINPKAKSKRDLWMIRYGANAELLSARTGKPCKCRYEPQEGEDEYEPTTFVYKSMVTGARNLPGKSHGGLQKMWKFVMYLVFFYQFVAVPCWYIFNKPCDVTSDRFEDKNADGDVNVDDVKYKISGNWGRRHDGSQYAKEVDVQNHQRLQDDVSNSQRGRRGAITRPGSGSSNGVPVDT